MVIVYPPQDVFRPKTSFFKALSQSNTQAMKYEAGDVATAFVEHYGE